MRTRHLRFGLSLIFSTTIVSTFGLVACAPSDAEQAVIGDDADGDVDPRFATPNDDPNLDDEEGLESPEEAAIDESVAIAEEAEPVEEIDVTGLSEAELEALARRRVASPVPGHGVNYPYGVKNSAYAAGFHTGQDRAAPIGTRVVAVRKGKIRWSNNAGGAYGRWIGLDADNGRTYVYCHLRSRRYKAGRRVKAGERIGRVGATGNVTGPHLHFEDHPKGPFQYAQVRRPKW